MSRISTRALIAGAVAAALLSGCYVVPVTPDGRPVYPGGASGTMVVPAYPISNPPSRDAGFGGAPVPNILQARLYPSNDAATQTGMLSGTVTNMMTGKGRFELDYRGELLVGEATRSPSSADPRHGVASAYGQRGTYMTCEYRMSTPYQGSGTCNVSSGAQYQVHIGG
jgi:hypothetical protein